MNCRERTLTALECVFRIYSATCSGTNSATHSGANSASGSGMIPAMCSEDKPATFGTISGITV